MALRRRNSPSSSASPAKVDQLMALADQLEAELTTRMADSRRLLEAILHEALA